MVLKKEYVKTIDFVDVTEAFKDMTDNDLIPVCKEYLQSEHIRNQFSKR